MYLYQEPMRVSVLEIDMEQGNQETRRVSKLEIDLEKGNQETKFVFVLEIDQEQRTHRNNLILHQQHLAGFSSSAGEHAKI